jgi:predicted nucleic acid-binding protein
MTFADIPSGESIFLDANIFVYYFAPHPTLGPACDLLVQKIGSGALLGFTSTPVLSELAHRLMTFQASTLFGWPSKVVNHLKRNPAAVGQLSLYRQAVAKVPQLGVRILTIPETLVETATVVSHQTGLLSNDALIVAGMRAKGLAHLASHDADFDRVPGLTRYAPA